MSERAGLLSCCGDVEMAGLPRAASKQIGVFADQANQAAVKFSNQNKRFYKFLTLAISMATYVTLFGLPVYSSYVSYVIFGEKAKIVNGSHVETCGPNMMGMKVNIGNKSHPVLVNYNMTFVKEKVKPYAWCGMLPASYLAWWPNVVQTAVFTVFLSTGSTVKLAWQCVAGTGTAVFNIYLLSYLYPDGAKSENYSEWVAWLDLILVLFLYLASKADVNTMMMGMNWTVCLMLHFMNPNTGPTTGMYKSFIPGVNWDAETTCVMLTSIMGCTLAVLATVFPRPLLNIWHVGDDANTIVQGLSQVFCEAVEYYKDQKKTPKRFQIAAKIDALSATVARVDANLEDSYWETFNMCHFGRMRGLFKKFNTTITKSDDEIYCLEAAITQLTFEDKTKAFSKTVVPSLDALAKGAVQLLKICTKCCMDGSITDEEQKEIQAEVENMDKVQKDLTNAYYKGMEGNSYIDKDLAADNLLVFSLAQWSKEVTDFARDLHKLGQEEKKEGNACMRNPIVQLCKMSFEQVLLIFDPRPMFEKEQIRFTLMNIFPVLLTMAVALYGPTGSNGTIFVRYSATMPGTLTLLVSKDFGATFFKNIQRLMGVTFGNVLPLLAMCVVHLLDCESWTRMVVHAASIWFYFFAFTFMYYTSDQWSLVGVLIAGFGCYSMLQQCTEDFDQHYRAKYKDIAQVIIAIMLKIMIGSFLQPLQPRDIAMQKIDALQEEIKKAFAAFFAGAIEGKEGDNGLVEQKAKVKGLLLECEGLAPKCDPKLEMVPGTRTTFKHDLFNASLAQMRLILSDIDMLISAMTGYVKETTLDNDAAAQKEEEKAREKSAREESFLHRLMETQPAFAVIREDVTKTLDTTFSVMLAILRQDTEDAIESDKVTDLKKMSGILELSGLDDFYRQITEAAKNNQGGLDRDQVTQLKRTRITVAVNALALATCHTGEISAKCFQSMLQG